MQNVKIGAAMSTEGEALSDVEKALSNVNIELFNTNGSFKDLDSVLGEIAGRWSSLNDVERSSIAYAVAGVRQRNIFLQLMDNWNESLYLSAVAFNSEGTAMQKQKDYMDSYQASLNQLKDTFDQFVTGGMGAEAFTGFVKGLNSTLETLNKVGLNLKNILGLISSIILTTKGAAIGGALGGGMEKMFGRISDIFGSIIGKIKSPTDTGLLHFTKEGLSRLNKRKREEQWYQGEGGTYDGNYITVFKKMQLEYVESLNFTNESLKKSIKQQIALGNNTKNTTKITQEMLTTYKDGNKTILALKEGSEQLDKAAQQRLAAYQDEGLTSEQAVVVENSLANARQKTISSTSKAITAALSKGIEVAGIATFVYRIVSTALGWFMKDAESASDKSDMLVAAINRLQTGDEVQKTAEGLELLGKISAQLTESGLTDEMSEQLTSIIDTLNKNLDVNIDLFKTSTDGTRTLRNLEEIQQEYYDKITSGEANLFSAQELEDMETLQAELEKSTYSAYTADKDISTSEGAKVLGWGAAGATAGAILAGPAAPIGALIGGIIGTIIGGAIEYFDEPEVQESIRGLTLEDALKETKKTRDELLVKGDKDSLDAARALEEKALTPLQNAYDRLVSKAEEYRSEYASAFGIYTQTKGKNLTSADKAVMQTIGEQIAANMTINQIAEGTGAGSFYQQVQDELNELILQLESGKLSYTEVADKIGTELLPSLAGNTKAIDAVQKTIGAQMPTVTKSLTLMKNSLDKLNETIDKRISGTQARAEMYQTLAGIASSQNLSAADASAFLNLGGGLNASRLINPALRQYSQELADLWEEYWGSDGKIAKSTVLETTEQLSNEYQRQVEIKAKELEIIQKQLEVQKAQNNLSEAERERNTLVFRNGRFVYEANPETIQQLQNQQESLSNEIDSLNTQKEILEYTKNELNALERTAAAVEKFTEYASDSDNKLGEWREIFELISADIIDNGVINDEGLTAIYEAFLALNKEQQAALVQGGLFSAKVGTDASGKAIYRAWDLQKDETTGKYVLAGSSVNAEGIANNFTDMWLDNNSINSLIRSAMISDPDFKDKLGDIAQNMKTYNIENINITESDNFMAFLDSVDEVIKVNKTMN